MAAALLSAAAAAQTPPSTEKITVTQQDLLDMTEAGLPTSLIVKTVRAAMEIPALNPRDLISLRRLGVAPEVLEAVVERGLAAAPAEEPVEPVEPVGKRRVRVSARLESKRSWYKKPFGGGEGGFAVYWAVQLVGEGAAVEGCPREPICWCSDSIGNRTCSDPDEELWREYLACHRVVEMRPDEGAAVFDFELTGPTPEEIRIAPLVMVRERDGSMRLEAWSSSGLGPTYAALTPGAAGGFTAELELLLETSGSRADLQISTSRFEATGDSRPRRGVRGVIELRPAAGVDLLPAEGCTP